MLDAGHLTAAMSGLEVSGRKRKTGATKLLGNEPSEGEAVTITYIAIAILEKRIIVDFPQT